VAFATPAEAATRYRVNNEPDSNYNVWTYPKRGCHGTRVRARIGQSALGRSWRVNAPAFFWNSNGSGRVQAANGNRCVNLYRSVDVYVWGDAYPDTRA
jgi:hypothetical protein